MGHLSYEDSKKRVVYGLFLLGAVTLVEVIFSLFGKGHIILKNAHDYQWIVILTSLIIIALSAYKAYFIIYEFMHMKYEVKALAMTVLLPTTLLIWALIAFFQEGNSWKNRRDQIKEKDELPVNDDQQGYLPEDTYIIDYKG